MVINPPLLFVSGLFFLALVSALFVASFAVVSLVLRAGRGRLSHVRAKQLLLMALVLPPVLAAVPTLSGATLRHSHARPLLEHHSAACRQFFSTVLASGLPGGSEASRLAGLFANGLAWFLVALGCFFLVRLLAATVRLERGLTPHLSRPSARLAEAIARVSLRRRIDGDQFYECPIPASYSCVLGVWQTRCILSRTLIAAADTEELEAIVAHEATHLRFRDVGGAFLVGIVHSLFFYLRPVGLLARRWREETELACDAAAVQMTGNPLAMAAAILRVSTAPSGGSSERALPAATLAFAEEAVDLTARRIENLLRQAQHSLPPGASETRFQAIGSWALTLALAALGGSLLLSPAAICYAHCSLEVVARLLP